MRLAFVGTRGVPARYGGFETAVEEVGTRLAERGHEIVVYCRNRGQTETAYRGMRLVNLPALRLRAAETPSHALLSALHQARRRAEVAFVFNAANAPLLPMFRALHIPVAINVDGIESRRDKWGRMGKTYYRTGEWMAARWSDALIADARGIQDYYRKRFGAESTFIPYGAPIIRARDRSRLGELDLHPREYHLVVARFEPENKLLLIVDGYERSEQRLPLVIVGGVPYENDVSRELRLRASANPRIHLIGSIWDQDLLDQLYAHALTYIHGHSVGGTNPSLLRAMGAAAPVVVFDVCFNREVAGPAGRFFTTVDDVAVAITAAENDPSGTATRGRVLQERAATEYTWEGVTDGYENLARLLAGGPGSGYPERWV